MQIKLTSILDSQTRFETEAQGNPKMTNSSKASSIRSPLTENTRALGARLSSSQAQGLRFIVHEGGGVLGGEFIC